MWQHAEEKRRDEYRRREKEVGSGVEWENKDRIHNEDKSIIIIHIKKTRYTKSIRWVTEESQKTTYKKQTSK